MARKQYNNKLVTTTKKIIFFKFESYICWELNVKSIFFSNFRAIPSNYSEDRKFSEKLIALFLWSNIQALTSVLSFQTVTSRLIAFIIFTRQ